MAPEHVAAQHLSKSHDWTCLANGASVMPTRQYLGTDGEREEPASDAGCRSNSAGNRADFRPRSRERPGSVAGDFQEGAAGLPDPRPVGAPTGLAHPGEGVR